MDERIVIPEERVISTFGGKTYDDHELMLAQLLLDGMCYLNNGELHGEKTICAFVACNDIFAWAYADAEHVTYSELPDLYRMHMRDPEWGVAKWCILRRKEMPQPPVLTAMKQAGVWDIDESQIGPNVTDAETQALFAHAAVMSKKGGDDGQEG